MKLIVKYIVLLMLFLASSLMFSQSNFISGYRIEGNEVVFTFDKREYSKVTHDVFGNRKNTNDLDINNVVVAGEFNNWSKKKWRMTKVDEHIYELRKNISDFTDSFSWEFKYVINNSYWAEPNEDIYNLANATKNGKRIHSVYNLKMYLAYPNENGNICFKLNGHQNAKNVVVAGSFNKWNEQAFKMSPVEDGWELTLQINPGFYEYRYIVDGKWMEDPNNPNKIPNEYGEYNSVLDIKKEITFFLDNHMQAKNVVLSGSFNNWNEEDLKMTKTENGWTYTLPLSGGKHHYKFIVDGSWILDPENPVKEYDNNSYINSVYMVR